MTRLHDAEPQQLHSLGVQAFQAQDFRQAAALLERAVAAYPENTDSLVYLGAAYRRLQRLADAERCYRRVLEIEPTHWDAHNNLGNVLRDAGRLAEAQQCYQRAVALEPRLAEAWHSLGSVLAALKRPAEAARALKEAVKLRPESDVVHSELGNALADQGRYEEAQASYRRALSINPQFASAHSNLGFVLASLGRLAEAEHHARHAVTLAPHGAPLHVNLAIVLGHLGRRPEAEASYRQALKLRPDYPDALNNLGVTLNELGRLHDAAQTYRELLRIRPEHAEGHVNLGKVLRESGALAESETHYRQALALRPDFSGAHSGLIFTLDMQDGVGVAQQQAERRRWYVQHALKHSAGRPAHANLPDPERRLRIGYMSADFRSHSACFAFAPVIRRRNKGAFEAICYSGTQHEDDVTAKLRGSVDHWRSTLGVADDELASQIRDDRIDILVDLSGHSGGNRLLTFARKPAPVQVTAWGHATGTGLETIDYLLADPVAIGEDERHHFAESVIDLPCILCYEPPAYLPDVSELPAAQGRPLTFSCVNRLEKVTDRVIALWGRILRATPDSRILMKDKGLRDVALQEQLLRRLEKVGGIAANRVVLMGASPHGEHLKVFQIVDIALDPFPQGGGISTAEALHMGVPVVTLRGTTAPSRVTASMLTCLGMQEWVATDDEEYVRIALAGARDLGALARTRQGLRARVQGSGYGDLAGYVRAVESAYRSMWQRWCSLRTSGRA